MCGIFGFNFKDEKLAEAMSAALRHRGPDDRGVFSDGRATLGHLRLSILDLSPAGRQPMPHSGGNIWISYNGEIYNFKELKKELEKKGYTFKSQTDTEVILCGYKECGIDFFKKMRGMWALAIYDIAKSELVLARDIFGIKPLYYSFRGGDLIFSSEIRAFAGKISKFGAMSYFVLGWIPHPWTIFENVKKINPGEVLIFNLKNKFLSFRQISLPDVPAGDTLSLSDPRDFEKIMLESVEKHLISDVPVGIFLSGGADSSILALMLKKLGKSPKAFTARIVGKTDADFAKQIADFSGLDYHEISMNEQNFEEMYSRLFSELDEPIADTALFTTMLVAKEASRFVKVVMTGEGGDELFWGYERYQHLLGLDKSGKFYPHFFSDAGNVFYLNYIKPILRRLRLGYFKSRRDLPGAYLDNISIDSDFARNARPAVYKYFADNAPRENLSLNFFDEKFYLPDNLLKKTDFATMSYSIEGRVPFLDREVYKFSKYLTQDQKLASRVGKKLLKEYLASNLPKELIFRRKEGFSLDPRIYIFRRHKAEIKEAVKYILDLKFDFISERALGRALQDEAYFELILRKFPQTVFSWLAFYKVLSHHELN